MGFGRKYRDMPTPDSIVFRVKIISMIAGACITMLNGFDFLPDLAIKISSGVLGATITVAHGIENMYGVKVEGMVKAKDVQVIKDEAVKIIIFIILINTYIFLY